MANNNDGIFSCSTGDDVVGVDAVLDSLSGESGREGKTRMGVKNDPAKVSMAADVPDFSRTTDATAVAFGKVGAKIGAKILIGTAEKKPTMDLSGREAACMVYLVSGKTTSKNAAILLAVAAGAIKDRSAEAAAKAAEAAQFRADLIVTLHSATVGKYAHVSERDVLAVVEETADDVIHGRVTVENANDTVHRRMTDRHPVRIPTAVVAAVVETPPAAPQTVGKGGKGGKGHNGNGTP